MDVKKARHERGHADQASRGFCQQCEEAELATSIFPFFRAKGAHGNDAIPFRIGNQGYADRKTEIIDQAILLWRIIHHTLLEYKKAHGDWIFLRHEDLSLDPVREFRILCGKLGLEFNSSTEDAIQNYSGPLNPQDPDAPVGSEETLKRNSRMNIRNWKNRLSLNEIEKIRNKVEDISRFFYSDSDWK